MRTLSLVAFTGVAFLAACGGEKQSGGAVETASAATPAAQPAAASAQAGPDGRQLYQRCAVCHQATGAGIAGSFPPLAGSDWATASSPALAIRVVLKGLQGQVTVKGQRFNSAMPAFGTGQAMSDAEVAAVLTYVRSSWGNKASAVTAEEVAKERSETTSRTTPWTAKDLGALVPGAH